MRLVHAVDSILVQHDDHWFRLAERAWDRVVDRDDLASWLRDAIGRSAACEAPDMSRLRPPLGSQEVWAAGVTYYRSRTARMEEAKSAGGGDFYDRVYAAARPELFFKATPHRVRGHGEAVRIRSDARWNVPEPELTLVVTWSSTASVMTTFSEGRLSSTTLNVAAVPASLADRPDPGVRVTPGGRITAVCTKLPPGWPSPSPSSAMPLRSWMVELPEAMSR